MKIQTSVFSVAGWPSSGSCWMKSLMDCTDWYGRVVEHAVDAERQVDGRRAHGERPLASRAITAGAPAASAAAESAPRPTRLPAPAGRPSTRVEVGGGLSPFRVMVAGETPSCN